jgi:hypothetical protein
MRAGWRRCSATAGRNVGGGWRQRAAGVDVPVFLDSRVAYAVTALLKPDRLARIPRTSASPPTRP